MVFNSFHFVVFFLVVYGAYLALPHRRQNTLLLAASYYFYGSWDWRFLSLLIAQTVIDFYCAQFMAEQSDPRRRRAVLLVSLVFNLTMLGFFKYFNFFSDNLRNLLQTAGIRADFVTLNVVLPIGISFYTFITMSYVIDVYRGVIKPCRRMDDFALFVSYFPHLVAGPILRADLLLPQIERPRTIQGAQIGEGLWLILWGLFKKVFVADNLAPIADSVFDSPANLGGAAGLLGVYAFAFQIYGDFSGYSDIARGTSKLMGIELNVNFLFPYFVRSPQEFWRNWHISLSTWLRDYLYISLGGNRGSSWFTKRNLLLTMLSGAATCPPQGARRGLDLTAGRVKNTSPHGSASPPAPLCPMESSRATAPNPPPIAPPLYSGWRPARRITVTPLWGSSAHTSAPHEAARVRTRQNRWPLSRDDATVSSLPHRSYLKEYLDILRAHFFYCRPSGAARDAE